MADTGRVTDADGGGKRLDGAVWWILSVLAVGLAVNSVTDWMGNGARFAWITPVLFAVAVVATMPGGILRWERYGRFRWALGLGLALLLGYLVLAVWSAERNWSLPVAIVQIGMLWMAAVLVLWQTLREDLAFVDAAAGVGFLLFGVALMLAGVAYLRGGDPLGGMAVLLLGVALLLFGVAVLRRGDLLTGVTLIVLGVGLPSGASMLPPGVVRTVAGTLLVAVSALLFGVSFLWGGDPLGAVAVLSMGTGVLLFVAALLQDDGRYWLGTALLLIVGGGILIGVYAMARGSLLLGVALLLAGVLPVAILGGAVLRDGNGKGHPQHSTWKRWLTASRSEASASAGPSSVKQAEQDATENPDDTPQH